MADTFSLAYAALNAVITTEFAAEGFTTVADHIHESLGHQGTVIGISPESQNPDPKDLLVQETVILIQFYAAYNLKIDPKQQVDPRVVTGYADRFLKALKGYTPVVNDQFWYFYITTLEYPKDPTGNKSRFEARIRAYANNPELMETA